MASLGQELKKQRESRNISLDEMTSSTKIVGRYLIALEEDRFDLMPGGFFVMGILKTYAKYVGLDEREVLAKYREAGVLEEPVRNRALEPESPPIPREKSKLLVRVFITVGIILFLIALAFLWRSRRPHKVAPPPQAATVLPQATVTSSPPQTPTSVPEAVKPEVKEEWKGLTMDISFQEETWIQLLGDGAIKIHGLFPAGQKARVQAEKEILIAVLGNAGGITFVLNGKPGKTLGRPGEVMNNIRITPDNLKEFLQNKEAPGTSN
jgi:cytoskeletal protein RodZ